MIQGNNNIFIARLAKLYKFHQKILPWRSNPTAYIVLLSEILLQKTDSKKVKEIFPTFQKKFPDITNLNNAKIEEIKKEIEQIGLRYRAKRLKLVASKVICEFDGNIPSDYSKLKSLPGVGDYIANAVLCFAYKQRVPLVDTNIIRIYSRIFGVKSKKTRPHTDKQIWTFAERMLPEKKYVEYNYALLDFATDICKAKKPLCGCCPMNDLCLYYKEENKIESRTD